MQNGIRRWRDQRGDDPPPTWVGAALRQIDRVEALVAELLDLARIRTGRLSLRTRRTDVAELARGVGERLREVLGRSDNRLVLAVDDRVDAECDPGRIEQVVANLLANAAQHAPGSRVVLRVRREGERAVIAVEDDGPGIPEGARERVFAPYEKLDTERRGPGLGLGLHIARQIVEAHGGRIRAAAGESGGALLVVELPAAPPAEAVGVSAARDGEARAP
jgi:signal transduction histidine kinase